jgi:hypothetical protein
MSLSSRLCILAAAPLAVLVWLGGTSSVARAECGDYVKVANPLVTGSALRNAPAKADFGEQPSPNNPTPCHGPKCSRREPLAPPPSPVTVTLLADQWALLSHHRESPDSGGVERIADLSIHPAKGFRSPLDRPPKA